MRPLAIMAKLFWNGGWAPLVVFAAPVVLHRVGPASMPCGRRPMCPCTSSAEARLQTYQATNSQMAWSYVRWPLDDVKVLSTAAFDSSESGRARTRFGTFVRRGLGVDLRMGDGLQSVAGQLHPDSRAAVTLNLAIDSWLGDARLDAYTGDMTPLRARVENGRLHLDEPTALPNGTEVDLVIDDEGDNLTEHERQVLHDTLERSWTSAQAGELRAASVLVDELRRKR